MPRSVVYVNFSQWKPTDAQWRAPSYADTRAAWQGSLPNQPGAPVRIEAAAFQGKPVSFEIIGPWTRAERMGPYKAYADYTVGLGAFMLSGLAVVVGGLILARRNLRLGRGDRHNATRLFVSHLLNQLASCISLILGWVCLIFLLRILLKNQKVAIAVCCPSPKVYHP